MENTRDEAEKILSQAGYATKYGSDGLLHIIPKSGSKWGKAARGTKALCGHTASRRDYEQSRPLCQGCARRVLVDNGEGMRLVPAWELLEVKK